MKKRSHIYEEIIEFLSTQNMINKTFSALEIDMPIRGKTIVSFIYKHSNKKYKGIWTLFFIRVPNEKPLRFIIDFELLLEYEKKFNVNMLKNNLK
jgi:hypothetical protein